MSPTSDSQPRSKILFVAITRLGDLLQASPAIVGLKREHPEAHITVAVESNFAPICHGIPGIDEVYIIDMGILVQLVRQGGQSLVEAYDHVEHLVEDLRSRHFTSCYNISSSVYTALLLKMLEIDDSRGWMADDEGCRIINNPWARLFAAFIYHSNREYNSVNLVDIVRCCAGVKDHPRSLSYSIPGTAANFSGEFLRTQRIEGRGPLICIQSGASQEKRQWSPHRFARLVQLLVEELDARIVFTGTPSERAIAETISSIYSHRNVAIAVGATDLGQLAALLKESALLITGDTGPMHLAVAVGTPVLALFVASAFCYETGPYSEGNIVVQPQIACGPCNPNFPCSRPDCHEQFSPELLLYLVKLRLSHSTPELLNMRVPASVADPRVIAVSVTTFDADNFLVFRPMNGRAGRNGFPADYYEGAREAYRQLWKEEFGMLRVQEDGALSRLADSGVTEQVTREIAVLAERGIAATQELQHLVEDTASPPHLLGEISKRLSEIDDALENLGLSHNLFGALIRMFVMERENLRGNDPLTLASDMGGIYGALGRRVLRFDRLFNYYRECLRQGEELCSVFS